ncbi:choice-of-anchor I family protein [Alcanivorax sp. DP30]|uniref:choice-of-anchor I family protein n=1 Tax=Alcanivorax sp. DP30 TaxID=2606217 RepID=UPI00136BCB7C|nr:choice-of-anchor I family protein [Alcanivorax sp. DP30]MZR62730.1 alkaline phosphatase [Alcanivorax sp. DP30]
MRRIATLGGCLVMAAALTACGGDSNDDSTDSGASASVKLNWLGSYKTGIFDASAAEIPAYDAASQRLFVVNAEAGELDVLDLSDPATPVKVDSISVGAIAAGAEVNSVAVQNGLVAIAVEADPKTDNGYVAIYQASDLSLVNSIQVGAQPDMITFTPNGESVMTANEGEPSDDYSVDPEGSISIVDIRDLENLSVATADFTAFNAQADALKAEGVRIYGPNASVAQDLEPEYIAVSADGTTAWVALQENNALAKLDVASATVTDVLPLGEIDRSVEGFGIDASDDDEIINIKTWPGVVGLYQPDAIHAYTAGGNTYLVTANEGDARAWGEDNDAYWGEEADDSVTPPVLCEPDASQGFVEEWRVKHLVHASGFDRRCGDDMPPQLRDLAAGALLDPAVFNYCGATAGDPGDCREDDVLGRLNITWTAGYKTDASGNPVMYTDAGVQDAGGDRIMYEKLYSYGGRSFSVRDENGGLVFDSGDAIEQFLASADCMLGVDRSIACADYFNTGHDEGDSLDSRSDAKGPEPEGLTIGQIGEQTFLFLGLERMGGILVYDITNPESPVFQDYLNSRNTWDVDPDAGNLDGYGDLGPEGLVFISGEDSPTGEPLLVVGHEVSGSTAVYEVQVSNE